MVETKAAKVFDANYEATICYNLACTYQLQGDLNACNEYLLKAIGFLEAKLESLK